MDNKKFYVYILLGAVILAGVGGYMISDSYQSEEPKSEMIVGMSATVIDSELYLEELENEKEENHT
tara:strand:- start:3163 stop:3360 length:198 start_codon:yes stop_codon:yes gene_type:complete